MRKTAKDIRVGIAKDKAKKPYGEYEKYEVDGWARTLTEAAEILSDPKKMSMVKKCLKMKADSLEMLEKFTGEK